MWQTWGVLQCCGHSGAVRFSVARRITKRTMALGVLHVDLILSVYIILNLLYYIILYSIPIPNQQNKCGGRFIYLSIFFRSRFCFFWIPGSMLSCFSDFLLFSFSASLPFCFSAFCFPCFSAFPASLLFCCLLFPLLCFSASLFSLLLCFCTSVPFYFCYSTFSFLQSCVFACCSTSCSFASLLPVFTVSVFFIFFCFILFKETLNKSW